MMIQKLKSPAAVSRLAWARGSRVGVWGPLAFTLVELLIAMTITLLLMAAMAKSFGVIGKSIQVGRSQVSLSSKLRSVSFRIRTDLRSRTADINPPLSSTAGSGYFMYYEGPLTEQSMALFGARPERKLSSGVVVNEFTPADGPAGTATADANYNDANASATYRQHGRIGDFDDYIAFTTEASGDQWFTGKVPAYLVEDGLTGADAMEPRVIRSKFAEVIMWASPVWEVDSATNLLQVATHANGGMPLYRDKDNDLIPDRIVLHQRTLLIRPDLNAVRSVTNGGGNAFTTNVLRPWNAVANPMTVPAPLERLYPIGVTNNGTSPMYPNYAVPTSATDNRDMLTSNWLVGMAPLHHFYDLSLRRVIDPETGQPTGFVAANSMADLVQPHNRFGHVRYPGRYFGRGTFGTGDDATSMPLLALAWNDPILTWQGTTDPRAPGVAAQPAWFPTGQPSPKTLNAGGVPNSRTGLFNGWLLPMFELGDPNPVGTSFGEHWEREYLATADPRWDRTGEDILTSNVLSFDIRGFDPTAPVFITGGPDGEPGVAGYDDDTSGSTDETDVIAGPIAQIELGAAGSDDVLVGVNDLAVYDLVGQPIIDPRRPPTYYDNGTMSPITGLKVTLGTRGEFVDLAYPMLAGSTLRERYAASITGTEISSPPLSVTANAQVATNFNLFMQSAFSGLPLEQPSAIAGMNSLKRSGKLVHAATNGAICFFQPTYDTWTDGYETDGFDQTHTLAGQVRGANLMGTTWVLNNPASSGAAPSPRLVAPTPQNLIQVDTGRWVPSEPETSPPFPTPLEAISVTVRVMDPSSEEMAQFTVVEALE
ncbi:MAG: hypothetical protein WBD31_12920 [Rubripirellula sp.]